VVTLVWRSLFGPLVKDLRFPASRPEPKLSLPGQRRRRSREYGDVLRGLWT
jgi:hypothetical protein